MPEYTAAQDIKIGSLVNLTADHTVVVANPTTWKAPCYGMAMRDIAKDEPVVIGGYDPDVRPMAKD
jgi:hypothetical protein